METLLGNPAKAKNIKWKPKINIKALAKEMTKSDFNYFLKYIRKNDKIFIAGHNGLVGSAIYRLLKKI